MSRITIKEPNKNGYKPQPPFGLYDEGHPVHEILRILGSSVHFYDKFEDDHVIPTIDFSKRATPGRSCKPKHVVAYLFDQDEGIKKQDYKKFLQAYSENRTFFEGLRDELACVSFALHRGMFGESFIHFYRTIERVSLALPLLYSKFQNNFEEAHRFHKSLFQAERDSDLQALYIFNKTLGQRAGVNAVKYTLNLGYPNASSRGRCVDEFEMRLQGGYTKNLVFDKEQGEIIVDFDSMPRIIVETRNRTFHAMYEGGNIDLVKVGGVQVTYNSIVREGMNWYFTLFSEMIRAIAKDYIRR